jgi:hypothetical protein
LLVVYFLFSAKSAFEAASARFRNTVSERSRLEHLDPFPNEANYRKMQVLLENYGAALNKLKEDLKIQVLLPPAGLAPNEFQSRLRQAMLTTAERARANRVKLPNNFALGFAEFTAALPNTASAPLLGQELTQIELLVNILIDARVDAVTAFKRTPLPEERGAAAAATPTPTPGRKPAIATPSGPKMLERGIVDLTFTAAPSAARKVLNQIASSNQQFFIIRTLHVRNQQDKGPPRESTETGGSASAALPASTPGAAIKFIVGNEHIETSARIEIVRFTF